jgi:hypothetical protein
MNAPYFKATEEPERICLILITEIIAYRKHRAALQCLNKHHNGQDYQGRKEGGLLKENMVLSAEFGVAPSVALLPAGRFAVPEVLSLAQQAKANTACAEPDAARPGEGCLMRRRVKHFILFLTPFSVLAAPLGGAAAVEGHRLQQVRLRSRPQPPDQDSQGRKEGGLLPEDAVLSAELARPLCRTMRFLRLRS